MRCIDNKKVGFSALRFLSKKIIERKKITRMSESYSNRFLYAKEVARTKRIHKNNLKNMKPTSKSNAKKHCDNSTPQKHSFLENNGKRLMLQKERQKKIERENLPSAFTVKAGTVVCPTVRWCIIRFSARGAHKTTSRR